MAPPTGWRWIANAVGRRTTYTCCGQSWTNQDAYRAHWTTHQAETPMPPAGRRRDAPAAVVDAPRPTGVPPPAGRTTDGPPPLLAP